MSNDNPNRWRLRNPHNEWCPPEIDDLRRESLWYILDDFRRNDPYFSPDWSREIVNCCECIMQLAYNG